MSELHTCPGCKKDKPRTKEYFDQTYDNFGDGLRTKCKECRQAVVRARLRARGVKPAKVAVVVGNMKTCHRCGETKENTEQFFAKHHRSKKLKGNCRSCDNISGVNSRKIPKNRTAVLLSAYQKHDRNAGRRCLLTRQEIYAVITQPCVYCGSEDNIGCDRIDNQLGHSKDNIVPCCVTCNATRSNKYDPLQMLLHIGPAIRAARKDTKKHIVVHVGDIPESEVKAWKKSSRVMALLKAVLPNIPKKLKFLTMLGTDSAIFTLN